MASSANTISKGCWDECDKVGPMQLEQPDVATIEKGLTHHNRGILPLLLTQVVVRRKVFIHRGEDFSLRLCIPPRVVLLLMLLYHVEVVVEFVKLVLAECRPQVDRKRYRDGVEHVYVKVFTHLGHAVK